MTLENGRGPRLVKNGPAFLYLPPQLRERLLPTGTMELVFRLDDDGRAASAVSGPRSEFAVLETSRPFSAIGVHFKPGGGFPFFDVPGSELHNQRPRPLVGRGVRHPGLMPTSKANSRHFQ